MIKQSLSLLRFRSSQFFELYLLHILNDGSFASLILLLPFIAKDLSLTLTQVGFLGTLLNLLSIFLAFPAAVIGAKLGGIKTLVVALCLYGIGYVGTGFATSFVWLLPMFLLAGAGFGLFHPIGFSLVAKLSNKTSRGKHMGNFTAVGDIGKTGIPALLTFIVVYIGWQTTSLLYGSIALFIALICFVLFFRKSTPLVITQKKPTSSMKLRLLLRNKRFLLATTTSFFDIFASSSFFIFLPFLLLKRGVDPVLLGSFAALFFIGSLFGKTVLGRLADKFGAIRIFILSELVMASFIMLLTNATAFGMLITCSLILGMFTKGTVPLIQTLIADIGEPHGEFDKLFGANVTTTSIAATLGPVILGFLSDTFGIVTAFYLMAGSALFAILPLCGLLFITRNLSSRWR